MKTESMVNETILNELKDYESDKRMTEEEMDDIRGGKIEKKDTANIMDDDTPL